MLQGYLAVIQMVKEPKNEAYICNIFFVLVTTIQAANKKPSTQNWLPLP